MKKKEKQKEKQKPISPWNNGDQESEGYDEEKLQISISCVNLIDPDRCLNAAFQVSVYFVLSNGEEKEIGLTEMIPKTVSPNFEKTIVRNFRFCSSGVLRFIVVKIEENEATIFGSVLVELDKIVTEQESFKAFPIENSIGSPNSRLLLRLNKYKEEVREEITFFLQANRLKNMQFFSKTNPFFRLYRKLDDDSFMLVHETECLKNNLNPVFQPEITTSGKLCGGNKNTELVCEALDRRSGTNFKLIGSTSLTLARVLEGEKAYFFYKKGHLKPRGELIFNIVRIKPLPSFLESIKHGQQFKLAVAVDFTGSNYLDNEPSLHHVSPDSLNQ